MFKRKRVFRKVLVSICLLLIMSTYLLYKIDSVFGGSILAIAKYKAMGLGTELINKVVEDKINSDNIHYQDLIDVHKDNEGKIVLMQANTVRINQLSSQISLTVQKSLDNMENQNIVVPIGQVLGTKIFAALGPDIHVKLVPVGVVKVNMVDKFEGAGINQTRHLIWLDLTTDFQIAVPLQQETFSVSTRVPICESVIVGTVPSTFVSMPGGLIGTIK